ncbi:ThuA domain-containing protein [Aureibacillus halotolerans]|uniref:ThuA-like domain-containing protein n=1 Tax=Aureibacillus halotolerans TaxID=1508390 RepID=A0A4R6U6Y1_9BACI|nr:ThuA domain-containing protein [Aureibacillus halotolerans]TDQ40295.1 hypothetical protein EV213_10611 [Aureibacillus halotolerans]
MKKALIVYGGWDGHFPKETAEQMASYLEEVHFQVQLSNSTTDFNDSASYDLLIPHISMGTIEKESLAALLEAVKNGVGLAGIHGGLGDSFRNEAEYQFMVGGQFVAHPGNIRPYTVDIVDGNHELTKGLDAFDVTTEQYNMHVDPRVTVLATTEVEGGTMPVAWTKMYGEGKVYYNALGHSPDIVELPQVKAMIQKGFSWAVK